jgi:hypothetical protein
MTSHDECMRRKFEFVPVFTTRQTGCVDAVDNAPNGFLFQSADDVLSVLPSDQNVFINRYRPGTLHSDPTCCSDTCSFTSNVAWAIRDYVPVGEWEPTLCACANAAARPLVL